MLVCYVFFAYLFDIRCCGVDCVLLWLVCGLLLVTVLFWLFDYLWLLLVYDVCVFLLNLGY